MQAVKMHVWEIARAAESGHAGLEVTVKVGGAPWVLPAERPVVVVTSEPVEGEPDYVMMWEGTLAEWQAAIAELRRRPVFAGVVEGWTPGPIEASCGEWFGETGRRTPEFIEIG